MQLNRAACRVLGNLLDQADLIVADVIRERGGTASNVRAAGHWARKSLGETATAAAAKDLSALKAMKIVKDARRLGEKY